MAEDPKRLLEETDLDPELHDALAQAQGAPGPELDMAAGLARLTAAIGSGGGPPTGGAPSGGTGGGAAAGGGGAAAKSTATAWITATGIVGALAVGSALWVSTTQKPAAPLARELPGVSGVAARVHVAPPPPPPAPVATAEPVAEPAPSAQPAPSASVPVKESKGDRIKREVAQLAQARAALASNPAQALALANAGHKEFAGGLLYQEREAIAVLALARMGNAGAARSRGKAFLSRFPKGPASDSVRSAIGEPEQK